MSTIEKVSAMGKILVVGSSNTDMVVKTKAFPRPGQTLMGDDFFIFPGGKGANQAVASARLGGEVSFVARVGDDLFGRQAVEGFNKEGIHTGAIVTDTSRPSGVAVITVDERGENTIVVAGGSNASLSEENIDAARERFDECDIVLAQLEIPLSTVIHAARKARQAKKHFILNPAPPQPLPDELLAMVSILTPNESELEALTGHKTEHLEDIELAARVLLGKGVKTVVVTLGSRGALICSKESVVHVPGQKVKAVDTTAAGDVFNGALATGLAEGKSIEEAVSFANAAAAVSVTRMGAQTSAPFRNEIK